MGAMSKTLPSYNVLYVDAGKAISGNGGSWANAFKTLAEAVASTRLCYTVDSILVAKVLIILQVYKRAPTVIVPLPFCVVD
jgi:hypothetical protein